MNPNDNTNIQHDDQSIGSLNFVPSHPEAGRESVIYETTPVTEITPKPEQLHNVEKTPQPIPQPKTETIEDFKPLASVLATPQTAPKILDDTKNLTTLHPVANTVDKLTTLADEEEGKFILEVEHAHGHK